MDKINLQRVLDIIYSAGPDRVNSDEVWKLIVNAVNLLGLQVDGLTTDTINVVPTFADLPDADVAGLNALAVVKETTGILFINRKRKGLYVSDGTEWLYVAEFSAAQIAYDDTATNLGVQQVQEAIEAVDAKISTSSTADRNRSNHTGTQLASTISDFANEVQTIIDAQPAPGITWEFYATNWDTAPTANKIITGGTVYNYTYDSITRYRFVPSTYTPQADVFYTNFNNITDVLSGPIVARGL